MTQTKPLAGKIFSSYEIFIIAILSALQFTLVLDFMVLSPLGAILMPALKITPAQFGWVVSAYAFSAGASGLLAAGFADKFDRKKLLLFFYGGFIIGTFLCGIAQTYQFLLAARIVTGIFGGVIGSISFAIITDLFKMEVRGRVMGFVQMAFAASQILGLPLGLYLANLWGWHSPFLLIVGISIAVGVAIIVYLKPIDAHLLIQKKQNAFQHLVKIFAKPDYLKAFAATTLLATGGFMLMPFGSTFSINNLGITMEQLPMIYLITGIFAMITGPLVGKFSDKIGKYTMFIIGSVISGVMVTIYCNLGITPIWLVIIINVIMFAGITGRIVSASALMTAIPDPHERGAFMGVNSSIQQIAGGVAAAIAGMIVIQTESGKLENYPLLGYVVVGAMIVTVIMMYSINKYVLNKLKHKTAEEKIVEQAVEAQL